MITVYKPNIQLANGAVTDDTIRDVVKTIYGDTTTNFNIKTTDRTAGQYIVVKDENTKYYVCFSSDGGGRNTYIAQGFPVVFRDYINDREQNKKFTIFLLNTDDKTANTDYNKKLIYRCLLTAGINILNLDSIDHDISPFNSYSDLQLARVDLRRRNSSNSSTYFSDDDSHISIFGKFDGANLGETFIFSLCIKKLIQERDVILYPVLSNGVNQFPEQYKSILEENSIIFGQNIDEINNSDIVITESPQSLRDTPKFHYNLLRKFGNKFCYLCGCDIEHLIIGSHIHRVTDIQNSNLETDEKIRQIIDGDNGLWLCANHDKLFEYGLIYFSDKLLNLSNRLDSQDIDYIKQLTFGLRKIYFDDVVNDSSISIIVGETSFTIADEDFNDNMRNYLALHKSRFLDNV